MKATLKDIAEYAQVSTATVSLVLNNKGNISAETREKIIESLKKFNYRKIPQQQVASERRTIKFLRIAKHGHVINRDHDVFIADYLDGLTQGANQFEYILEANSYMQTPIDDIIDSAFQNSDLAGAVILATELNDEDMIKFERTSVPIVFIDNYSEFLPFDFVDMDNNSSIHMAYQYIKSLGFDRIGFISSYSETYNFKLREIAYRKDIEREENAEPAVIFIDSTFDGAYQDMKSYLESYSADLLPVYICANDIIALGTMKALREFGCRIPEDVSLIGFDNLPQTAQTTPPMSSIAVSKRRIARLAVQQLYNRINDPETPTIRTLVGGKLIIRESIK